MKTGKGIVAAVFARADGQRKFLVLHRVLNWTGWEMPKGSVEGKEKFSDAAKRELFEETGLRNIVSVKKLRAVMRFFDPIRNCNREMHGFVVEVSAPEKISFANNPAQEHDAFEWLDSEPAMKKLTHAEQKKILKSALGALKRK